MPWRRNELVVVVVVFTLNRSFYPMTSAIPAVPVLILHPREIPGTNYVVTVREKPNAEESRYIGKSSASVPGTRVTSTTKRKTPPEK